MDSQKTWWSSTEKSGPLNNLSCSITARSIILLPILVQQWDLFSTLLKNTPKGMFSRGKWSSLVISYKLLGVDVIFCFVIETLEVEDENALRFAFNWRPHPHSHRASSNICLKFNTLLTRFCFIYFELLKRLYLSYTYPFALEPANKHISNIALADTFGATNWNYRNWFIAQFFKFFQCFRQQFKSAISEGN